MPGLTAAQRERFDRDGYLVVENVIDVETYLDPMVADYTRRLDEVADALFAAGELTSTYADLGFAERLIAVYADAGRDLARYFDFSLPLRADIKPDEPCFFGPSIFNVLRNPAVLDVIESLIGGEIYSNPVQHVRLKPPERLLRKKSVGGMVAATPWHQDASVVVEDADETEIITVWVPVTDATEENGCLAVVPRNHEAGLLEHCPAVPGVSAKYLSTKFFDADRALPVPMKRGSALFMNKMTPHCSLPNVSDHMRWSMDLRYNPSGQPTGRPEFPGFVARSRRYPSAELTDAAQWRDRWLDTRARISADPTLVSRFRREFSGAGCA